MEILLSAKVTSLTKTVSDLREEIDHCKSVMGLRGLPTAGLLQPVSESDKVEEALAKMKKAMVRQVKVLEENDEDLPDGEAGVFVKRLEDTSSQYFAPIENRMREQLDLLVTSQRDGVDQRLRTVVASMVSKLDGISKSIDTVHTIAKKALSKETTMAAQTAMHGAYNQTQEEAMKQYMAQRKAIAESWVLLQHCDLELASIQKAGTGAAAGWVRSHRLH